MRTKTARICLPRTADAPQGCVAPGRARPLPRAVSTAARPCPASCPRSGAGRVGRGNGRPEWRSATASARQAERTGAPIDAPGLRIAARVFVDYQRRLHEANSADFGDLLLWPTRTMHKGKGLEFRHVFLPAWEANAFPPAYGDLAEERRLAYLGLTRGMARVTVSHCRYRRGITEASPFVDDIPEAHRHCGWLRLREQHRGTTADNRRAGRGPVALLQER